MTVVEMARRKVATIYIDVDRDGDKDRVVVYRRKRKKNGVANVFFTTEKKRAAKKRAAKKSARKKATSVSEIMKKIRQGKKLTKAEREKLSRYLKRKR